MSMVACVKAVLACASSLALPEAARWFSNAFSLARSPFDHIAHTLGHHHKRASAVQTSDVKRFAIAPTAVDLTVCAKAAVLGDGQRCGC